MYPQDSSSTSNGNIWVFGYGSLIWRPSFPFIEKRPARIQGWVRKFWQGSHDHRGTPNAPGRVLTLIPDSSAYCDGMAYLLAEKTLTEVFEHLDYREKNGYERFHIELLFDEEKSEPGLVYVAPENNLAYLGPASITEIAQQIFTSAGPSGSNREYLMELATALRHMGIQDQHIVELESAVLKLGVA